MPTGALSRIARERRMARSRSAVRSATCSSSASLSRASCTVLRRWRAITSAHPATRATVVPISISIPRMTCRDTTTTTATAKAASGSSCAPSRAAIPGRVGTRRPISSSAGMATIWALAKTASCEGLSRRAW